MCIAWFEYAEVLQTWLNMYIYIYICIHISNLKGNWNIFIFC